MITTLPAPTPTRLAPRWLPWALGGALVVLYSMLSITNHLRLGTTGFDLGIFEQAVRGYAHFSAPVSELKSPGYVLLGDHFHPILAVLAPFYRLFPSPITLLVAQAVLIGLSVVPVARLALGRFGTSTGVAVTVAYGLSWGLQTAADFDFHEVMFAVPLVAFSIECLLGSRWRAAVLWAAPLVLVKEDLPITLAAVGVYVFLKGQRRLGLWVVACALAAFVLIIVVTIPSMNPVGEYAFTGDIGPDRTVWETLSTLFTPTQKVTLLAALLAPTAFLALFSPVTALAIPTLLWRLTSVNPFHWATGFHYNAVLMPILYLGLVDALTSGRRYLPGPTFRRARAAVVAACVVMTIGGVTLEPLGKLTRPETWQHDQRAADAQRVLDQVPNNALVAASNNLVPHLTDRCTVRLFPAMDGHRQDEEWIIVDRLFVNWPYPASVQARIFADFQARYRTVASVGDFVLLRRG
jgi:uncharacterized membrane protein